MWEFGKYFTLTDTESVVNLFLFALFILKKTIK